MLEGGDAGLAAPVGLGKGDDVKMDPCRLGFPEKTCLRPEQTKASCGRGCLVHSVDYIVLQALTVSAVYTTII